MEFIRPPRKTKAGWSFREDEFYLDKSQAQEVTDDTITLAPRQDCQRQTWNQETNSWRWQSSKEWTTQTSFSSPKRPSQEGS